MYKIVSLFTGAGGLDLGLEAAGYETCVAVEMESVAVQTLRANRHWPVLEGNIHDIKSSTILETAGLKQGEASLLIGGPPCQPFSKSGYWSGGDAKRLDDPRATTLEAYLRVLKDIQPKAFLLENVAGLAYKKKDEGMTLLKKTLLSINKETGTSYSFSIMLLNAADFGVPQLRERVFIIGHREGMDFEPPKPTHARCTITKLPLFPNHSEQLKPGRNAWDALHDLEEDDDPTLKMTGKWANLFPSIPEGSNYLHHTERGDGKALFGWRTRYWSFLLKLAKNLPSWTITASPGPAIGPFHWKNRRLSPRELCRLQTFPDGYNICGKLRDAQRQLGNAVPSALAEKLGLEIRRQFFKEDLDQNLEASLLPPKLLSVASPEKHKKVPKEYQHLIGTHKAHPGTGKGPGATKNKKAEAA